MYTKQLNVRGYNISTFLLKSSENCMPVYHIYIYILYAEVHMYYMYVCCMHMHVYKNTKANEAKFTRFMTPDKD